MPLRMLLACDGVVVLGMCMEGSEGVGRTAVTEEEHANLIIKDWLRLPEVTCPPLPHQRHLVDNAESAAWWSNIKFPPITRRDTKLSCQHVVWNQPIARCFTSHNLPLDRVLVLVKMVN